MAAASCGVRQRPRSFMWLRVCCHRDCRNSSHSREMFWNSWATTAVDSRTASMFRADCWAAFCASASDMLTARNSGFAAGSVSCDVMLRPVSQICCMISAFRCISSAPARTAPSPMLAVECANCWASLATVRAASRAACPTFLSSRVLVLAMEFSHIYGAAFRGRLEGAALLVGAELQHDVYVLVSQRFHGKAVPFIQACPRASARCLHQTVTRRGRAVAAKCDRLPAA